MTADAPTVDPFDASSDASPDFLATATAHLMLAATGIDVAGNLDAALRTILTAASRPDTPLVEREAVVLARAALVAIAETAAEMDMVTRYRRLSARVGRDFNGYGPAPSPPPRKLH